MKGTANSLSVLKVILWELFTPSRTLGSKSTSILTTSVGVRDIGHKLQVRPLTDTYTERKLNFLNKCNHCAELQQGSPYESFDMVQHHATYLPCITSWVRGRERLGDRHNCRVYWKVIADYVYC